MKHLFFFLLLQYYLYANIKINNLYDCTYPSRAVCSAAYDLNNHRVHACKTTVKNLKKKKIIDRLIRLKIRNMQLKRFTSIPLLNTTRIVYSTHNYFSTVLETLKVFVVNLLQTEILEQVLEIRPNIKPSIEAISLCGRQ